MRNKILSFALVCLFVVIVACVTTKAVRLGTGPARPPVPEDQVAVYRTADLVPAKYEEIALLSSTGESLWTNEEQMWRSMRKKAGKLGANAIILDAMSEPSAGAKVASALFGVAGAQRKGKAIAIYVLPSEEEKTAYSPLEKQQQIEKQEVAKEEIVEPVIEAKEVKIYLKDGTILKAKILGQDEKKLDIETSMGKFSISRKDVLKMEPFMEKEATQEEAPVIIKEEKEERTEKPEVVVEEKKEPIKKAEAVLSSFPKKVEVIIDQSEIRLKPDRKSQIIGKIRFGTILQSTEKTGDWYKVNLPSSAEGITISGYIHKYCIRVIVEKD